MRSVIHEYRTGRALAGTVVVVTARDLSDDDRRRLNGGVERVIQKSGQSAAELLREVGETLSACVQRGRRDPGAPPSGS